MYIHRIILQTTVPECLLLEDPEMELLYNPNKFRDVLTLFYTGNVTVAPTAIDSIIEIAGELGVHTEIDILEVNEEEVRLTLFTDLDYKLKMLYNDEASADIILECNETIMHAHAVILAARSGFFLNGITHWNKDSFDLTEFEDEVVDVLLQYLYTDYFQSDIDIVLLVLHASFYFGLPSLQAYCMYTI